MKVNVQETKQFVYISLERVIDISALPRKNQWNQAKTPLQNLKLSTSPSRRVDNIESVDSINNANSVANAGI